MVIGIDLIAAYQLVKEHFTWKEIDPLSVDRNWLDLAKMEGHIDTDREYRWSDPNKVETRRLAGTHDYVWFLDEKNRTRRKVVNRDLVLTHMTEPPVQE